MLSRGNKDVGLQCRQQGGSSDLHDKTIHTNSIKQDAILDRSVVAMIVDAAGAVVDRRVLSLSTLQLLFIS